MSCTDDVMKTPKPLVTSKSFRDLKTLLGKKAISLPPCPVSVPVGAVELSLKTEEELFREAMEGVDRISRENCVERILVFRPSEKEAPKEGRNPGGCGSAVRIDPPGQGGRGIPSRGHS